MNKKFDEIISNRINGNITDFNRQVRALSKIQLLMLVEYWAEVYNHERVVKILINSIR